MSTCPHNATYKRSSLDSGKPLTATERDLIQQVKEKLNSQRVFNFTIHQHETRASRYKITLPTISTDKRLREIIDALKRSIRVHGDNYFISCQKGIFVFDLVP